ncbi:hypothetical protein C5167_028633 [Papaver somniferum]|nr:hypothetical protein C5167_028633 [Papaver somniferum]
MYTDVVQKTCKKITQLLQVENDKSALKLQNLVVVMPRLEVSTNEGVDMGVLLMTLHTAPPGVDMKGTKFYKGSNEVSIFGKAFEAQFLNDYTLK